ncbi:MAG: autotransporter-associated beta strand repeat-containing protein [Verrucomicrobiota bacterium]
MKTVFFSMSAFRNHDHPISKTVIVAGILVLSLLMGGLNPLSAQISISGSRTPSSESFWTGGGSSSDDGTIGGNNNAGVLEVEGGSQLRLANGELLGPATGEISSATISGVDPFLGTISSRWNLTGNLSVASQGLATLTIELEGLVNVAQDGILGESSLARGTATVTGSGSQWNINQRLLVGDQGRGDLTISDGGVVTSANSPTDEFSSIAFEDGSRGTVTVTGIGSQWLNRDSGNNNPTSINVGRNGNGTLRIEAGGFVSNADAVMASGVNSVGSATVTGSGSEWSQTGNLTVGSRGEGTLRIESGGEVSSRSGVIAQIETSDSEVTVTGTDSQWTVAEEIEIGSRGTGALTIADGGTVTSLQGFLGSNVAGDGTVTVTGMGSQWKIGNGLTSDPALVIGADGRGILRILDGGELTTTRDAVLGGEPSGNGTVTVSGSGSAWIGESKLVVGEQGTGELTVADGGLVVTGRMGILGDTEEGSGTVTVTGGGSLWNLSQRSLIVGSKGNGTLGIEEGGAVRSLKAVIGSLPDSTGIVTVTGESTETGNASIWLVSEGITVGDRGEGSLDVEAGGEVTNESEPSFIGQSGGVGNVRIVGAGSRLNLGGLLNLGNNGTGQLLVADGGRINMVNDQGIRIGLRSSESIGILRIGEGGASGIVNAPQVFTENGTGTVIFNHSDSGYTFSRDGASDGAGVEINRSTALVHQGSGETILTAASNYTGGTTILDGILRITDVGNGTTSGALGRGTVTVESGGTLAGEGTVIGVTEVSGTLSPGNSAGTLRFASDLVLQSTSTTFIELESLTSFDQIEVDGNITYGGELLIGFLGGYIPVIGDSFQIFDSPNVIGGMTFTDVRFQQSGFEGTFDAPSGTLDITAVPEAATTWLIALGAALVVLRRKRWG